MNRAEAAPAASLILAGVLLALAGWSGWRQWADRRRRSGDLPEADARYFAGQDARRFAGSALMVALALGIALGVRIDIRGGGRAARQLFGWTWLGVSALVLVLLVLAFADWLAIVRYAQRQRQALIDERVDALADARRRYLPRDRNGRGGPSRN